MWNSYSFGHFFFFICSIVSGARLCNQILILRNGHGHFTFIHFPFCSSGWELYAVVHLGLIYSNSTPTPICWSAPTSRKGREHSWAHGVVIRLKSARESEVRKQNACILASASLLPPFLCMEKNFQVCFFPLDCLLPFFFLMAAHYLFRQMSAPKPRTPGFVQQFQLSSLLWCSLPHFPLSQAASHTLCVPHLSCAPSLSS